MKILVDAHMLGSGEGGNERYIINLINAIGNDVDLTVIIPDIKQVKKFKVKVKPVVVKASNWLRYLIVIPYLSVLGKTDWIITTYFASPLIAKKNLLIVHDLSFWRLPELFDMKLRLKFILAKLSMKIVTTILVPSNFTKMELREYLSNRKINIRVVSNVISDNFVKLSKKDKQIAKKKMKIKGELFIAFGSPSQKRNPELFVKYLTKIGRQATLFVIGENKVAGTLFKDKLKIVFTNNVSDENLNRLMNVAKAVLYQSEYEGFGLPVLEAMSLGTPVIASRIKAVEEIGGKIPFYFDNDNPDTVVSHLKKLVKNSREVDLRVKGGLAQSKKYHPSILLSQLESVWK